jgi:hypothetical protein
MPLKVAVDISLIGGESRFRSYAALHDDHNAKQAMYWSSDGNQLVVADVSALCTAEEMTSTNATTQFSLNSQNFWKPVCSQSTTSIANLPRSVDS